MSAEIWFYLGGFSKMTPHCTFPISWFNEWKGLFSNISVIFQPSAFLDPDGIARPESQIFDSRRTLKEMQKLPLWKWWHFLQLRTAAPAFINDPTINLVRMNLQINSKVVLKSSLRFVGTILAELFVPSRLLVDRAPPPFISEQPGMSQQQLHMHSNQVRVCAFVIHNCQL